MVQLEDSQIAAGIAPHKVLGLGTPLPPTFNPPRYVDSTATAAKDAAGFGKEISRPYATIAFAVTDCPADTALVVLPGHTESVSAADAWKFKNSGVWVMGLGWGARRPTITFGTSTAAQIKLSKASTVLQNLLFVNSLDALVLPLLIGADDCAMLDFEYRENLGVQAVTTINISVGIDRCLLENFKILGDTAAPATSGIVVQQSNKDCVIRDFWIEGNYTDGCIDNNNVGVQRLMIIGGKGSYARNSNSNDQIINLSATATGFIAGPMALRLADNAANITESIVGAAMQIYASGAFEIGVVNADGEAALQWNGVKSTDA